MDKICKMLHKQITLFTTKNNFTLVELGKDSWDIFNRDQIIISIELSVHNSKIIIELTGYLSTEINISSTPNILEIINSDKIKEEVDNSNINLLGTLLLNSRTLVFDKQFTDDIKYLVLFELCTFDFENKTISKLISREYYQTFLLNLN